MSSYDEHLISMAGGDGDPLDAAYELIGSIAFPETPEERDAAEYKLIALVRKQAATLAAVLNLANTSGRCGWRISADQLRKTLRGES